jgi:hypothetical protein
MIGMRAEKGTPNANAFRTLIVGVGVALVILVGIDPAERLYDEHLRSRPWVEAHVEVLAPKEGKPLVSYSVTAPTLLHATWKAWVEGERGTRLCGGQGPGDYGPTTKSPKVWSWDAWIGAPCWVPNTPFRLCVSYVAELPSRARADFGPYCSELYTGPKAD